MKKYLLTGLFIAQVASAQIVEISQMNDILPSIDSETWVVFDLDNTVMEPAQTLGTDQWYDYMVKKLGSDEPALAVWSRVQDRTQMIPVEPTTPDLIKNLQQEHIRVFALTARPKDSIPTTITQLKSIGVEFERVVAVGPGANKGEVLSLEIQKASVMPAKVVFVDDKAKHVRNVDVALSKLPEIEHLEFRYGAADSRVRSFNKEIADLQLDRFETSDVIISDQEALAEIESSAPRKEANKSQR